MQYLQFSLLLAGLLVGWAAQMIYVAFKYGRLEQRVDDMKADVDGLGKKVEALYRPR